MADDNPGIDFQRLKRACEANLISRRLYRSLIADIVARDFDLTQEEIEPRREVIRDLEGFSRREMVRADPELQAREKALDDVLAAARRIHGSGVRYQDLPGFAAYVDSLEALMNSRCDLPPNEPLPPPQQDQGPGAAPVPEAAPAPAVSQAATKQIASGPPLKGSGRDSLLRPPLA